MFTKDEFAYLLALVEAEGSFDEESRHLSEECSDERDAVRSKLEDAFKANCVGKPDLLYYARAEPEQVKWRSEFEGHIQSARDNFADDELEIDDTPLISPGVDGSGVWVNAWVWVASNQDG